MSGIRVELELEDGSFTSKMIHAGETVKQFNANVGQQITSINRLNDSHKSFLSTLRDVTVVLGLTHQALGVVHSATTSWVHEIIGVNAEFERMVTLMKSLSVSADPLQESVKAVTALRDMAKTTPFSLDALHQSFVRLNSAGLPAAETLKALTDAVAAFGGGDDVLARASLAFQEMAGKGVVQMKELRNQLSMAVPNAMHLLARSVGVSVNTLMSDVHTGTVNATAAIAALSSEMELTFGGAAARQMETYNGQIIKTYAILQKMSIEKIGKPTKADGTPNEDGFFEKVKNQVKDFNNMLEGPIGSHLATHLGEALTTGIGWFRKIIDTVIEFRHQIEILVDVFALKLGGNLVLAALRGIAEGFSSIGANSVATTLKIEALTKAITLNKLAQEANTITTVIPTGPVRGAHLDSLLSASELASFGALDSVVTSSASKMTALKLASKGAMLEIASVATYAAAAVPWIAGIGLAIYFAADYFGVFTNKAKEAWIEIERIGATSRQAALDAEPYIAQMEKELAILVKKNQLAANMKGGIFAPKQDEIDKGQKQEQDARKTIDALKKRNQENLKEGTEADARKIERITAKDLDDKVAALQRNYNAKATQLEKDHVARVRFLAESNLSTSLEDMNYEKQTKANRLQASNEIIAKKQEEYDIQLKIAALDNDPIKKTAATNSSDILYKDLEAEKVRRKAIEDQATGLEKTIKVPNDKKNFDAANVELEKLQASIEGYSAGIRGGDAESEKLYQTWLRLAHVNAFDPNTIAIKELIEEIRRAKTEADDLDKIMKGGNKLDADIANAKVRLLERKLEAETPAGATELEKIELRQRAGMYAGYGGDTPAQRALTNLRIETQRAGAEAAKTGTALSSMFDGGLMTKAGGFLDKLKSIAETMGLIGKTEIKVTEDRSDRASNKDTGDITDRQREAWNFFASKGYSGDESAKIMGNIQAESEFNPNKVNPNDAGPGQDSVGIVQWNRERLAQMKAYVVDMLGKSYNEMTSDEKFKGQLSFTDHEIQTNQTYKNALKNEKNAGDFGHVYEGYKEGISTTHEDRTAYGDSFYKKFNSPQEVKTDLEKKDIAQDEVETRRQEAVKKLAEAQKELNKDIEVSNNKSDDMGKHQAKILAQIKAGELDSSNIDVKSDKYKALIALAIKADEADKKSAEYKKNKSAADTVIEGRAKELNDQKINQENAMASINDPNQLKGSSEWLRTKRQQEEETAKTIKGYGEGSPEALAAAEHAQVILDGQRNQDVIKLIDTETKKIGVLRQSGMTQEQINNDNDQKLRALFEKQLAAFTGSAEDKMALTKKVADFEAASDAARFSKSPVGAQLKQWGDLTQNLQQGVSGWMNSSIDSLTQLITTGHTNWKALANSIISDMLKMSLKFGMSQLLGGGGSKSGGAGMPMQLSGVVGGSKGGGGSKGLASLLSVFTHHTGGMIGESGMLSRTVSANIFNSAPRFHTGGIIGSDEVPIIARQDEGVFTKEQMKAIGGRINNNNGSATIHNNVNVNATGGTKEQNEDLAKQISDHVDRVTRAAVNSELMNARRPGNLLSM